MKILVFSPYYPPHAGGLESHSLEWNREMAKAGHWLTVLTPRLPASSSAHEQEEHITVFRYTAFEIIPNYPLPKFWDPLCLKTFQEALGKDHDILVSRTRFFFSSLLALIIAKFSRKPLIHIEHGSEFVKLSSPLKSFLAYSYDQSFGRLVLACSTENVSISRAVERFVMRFTKRKSQVIYRGIDFTEIDSIKPNHSLQEEYSGKIVLCTSARLYKWKGIERTLEALHLLSPETLSKLVFIVIGNGEDFERLSGLKGNLPVRMLGSLSRQEAIGVLKIADIYIHSSFPGGGLSTSLLEAMACKKTIIASSAEGADEVIIENKTGILLPAFSPATVAEKIALLLEDKEKRETLGEGASQSVRNQFSWKASIEKYLTLFKHYERT